MSQNKTTLQILIWAVVLCFPPLFLYQNCSSSEPASDSIIDLKGNGEPYVGVTPETGLYYARKSDYVCDPAATGPKLENVTEIMDVNSDNNTVEITDNCSGAKTNVDINEVSSQEHNLKFATYEETLYEQFDDPPAATEPIPVLICHYNNVGSFLGLDHILLEDIVNNMIITVSRYARLVGGVPRASATPPKPLTGSAQTQFPPGVPASLFIADNFLLKVSSVSPPEIFPHRPSQFQGVVDSEYVDAVGPCIDPNLLP